MTLSPLLNGMGFGTLCAATCLVAGFGGSIAFSAYAIGGAAHVLLALLPPASAATGRDRAA